MPAPTSTPDTFSQDRYTILRRQGVPAWLVRAGDREIGFVKRKMWKGSLHALSGRKSAEEILVLDPMFKSASNNQRRYDVRDPSGLSVGGATGLGELFDTDGNLLAKTVDDQPTRSEGGLLRRLWHRYSYGWRKQLSPTDEGPPVQLELTNRFTERLEVTVPKACRLDPRMVFAVALLTRADLLTRPGRSDTTGSGGS